MKELLRRFTPEQFSELPEHEAAQAILCAMAELAKHRIAGKANRGQVSQTMLNHAVATGNLSYAQRTELEERLQRQCRHAFQRLEDGRLIEPDTGMNGANGYVVLTPEGREMAANPVDLEAHRLRKFLQPDMLHPKLQGKPLRDFRNGDYGSAVFEAFKVVEIEVRQAAGMGANSFGVNLMRDAFAENTGPLTDTAENAPAQRALSNLFAGAIGRFKNAGSHTNPAYDDVRDAIAEMMLASRLLAFLDEPGRQ